MVIQPLLMTERKIPALCVGHRPKDIFNMDETGLIFRETTYKGFYTKGEDCVGRNQYKEGITLTATMMGKKLKPLIIGRAH